MIWKLIEIYCLYCLGLVAMGLNIIYIYSDVGLAILGSQMSCVPMLWLMAKQQLVNASYHQLVQTECEHCIWALQAKRTDFWGVGEMFEGDLQTSAPTEILCMLIWEQETPSSTRRQGTRNPISVGGNFESIIILTYMYMYLKFPLTLMGVLAQCLLMWAQFFLSQVSAVSTSIISP